MDNFIIGLLPVVEPEDDMKIAVSGGIQAITVGQIRQMVKDAISNSNGGNGGFLPFSYKSSPDSDWVAGTNGQTIDTNSNIFIDYGFKIKVNKDSSLSHFTFTTDDGLIVSQYDEDPSARVIKNLAGYERKSGDILNITVKEDETGDTFTIKIKLN